MRLHLKDDKPLLYLSGTGTHGMTEEDLIKNGAKYRCYSYAYVCPGGFYYQKNMEESLKISVKNKMGIMMDSGAHSFHKLVQYGLRKTKGKWTVKDFNKLRDETVENYANFVKANGKKWDWYVTFDYVKDCPTIYDMQLRLEKYGIRPVPVYHGDKPPKEWLERYCQEGHKLIGIGVIGRTGNIKKQKMYYDICFNTAEKYGVLLHGLAVTSLSLMFGYPWYSVDSATWAKVAAFGCILTTSDSVNDTLGYIHMTDRRHGQSRGIEYLELTKSQKKEMDDVIRENGFDPRTLVDDGAQRSLYNIYIFSNKLHHLKQSFRDAKVRWKSLI